VLSPAYNGSIEIKQHAMPTPAEMVTWQKVLGILICRYYYYPAIYFTIIIQEDYDRHSAIDTMLIMLECCIVISVISSQIAEIVNAIVCFARPLWS
jgi:hypothetical protein